MILLLTSSALAFTNDFSIHFLLSFFFVPPIFLARSTPRNTLSCSSLIDRVQHIRIHMHNHTMVGHTCRHTRARRKLLSSVLTRCICMVFPNRHTLALSPLASFHFILFFFLGCFVFATYYTTLHNTTSSPSVHHTSDSSHIYGQSYVHKYKLPSSCICLCVSVRLSLETSTNESVF